jgi:alkylation response protein AidB-like acyl-CoA dehydrogenase
MDLKFSPEEEAFRAEVRQFLQDNLPADVHAKMREHRALTKDEIVSWQRTLNTRGWATPSWPKAWGGPGWDAVYRYIFLDELHQFPAPEPLSFNVSMIGPVIGRFGSDEQRAELLPKIANLDIWWCQGFSEPGAGSDLASLTTKAVRDGDHYVVNGSKMWQGMGHHADWMFTLVRTDNTVKKQAGITFLLIDMKSSGVTVEPIITIDGRHEVNSVFLENVRVPVENRIYEENKGWDVAKFLLGNERTGISRIGMSKFLISRAKKLAEKTTFGSGTLAESSGFRRRCVELEAELRCLEITQMRVLAAMKEDERRADPRSSILKIKGVELRQAASELLLYVAGPAAMESRGEFDDDDGETAFESSMATVAPVYFNLRAASIYGGSTEVQKNIIAKSVLRLA